MASLPFSILRFSCHAPCPIWAGLARAFHVRGARLGLARAFHVWAGLGPLSNATPQVALCVTVHRTQGALPPLRRPHPITARQGHRDWQSGVSIAGAALISRANGRLRFPAQKLDGREGAQAQEKKESKKDTGDGRRCGAVWLCKSFIPEAVLEYIPGSGNDTELKKPPS